MIQIFMIVKILTEGYDKWVLSNDLDVTYFSDFVEEFNYIKDYYDKYGTTVDVNTFLGHFKKFRDTWVECTDPDKDLLARLRCDARLRMSAKLLSEFKDAASKIDDYEDEALANVIAGTYQKMGEIISKTSLASYRSEQEILQQLKDKFEYVQAHRNDIHIPTGVDGLEDLHGWDKDADYVIVAGRPSEGKSYILCKFALEAAKQGLNVGFVSLEMPWHQIDHRITSMITHLSLRALDDGYDGVTKEYMNFLENERPKYHIHYADMNDFSGNPTVSKIEAFCIKKKLDIVFIDQMSFVAPEGRKKDDYRDVAGISRNLKVMRDKLNIPVIVANQLNRTKLQENEVDLIQLAGADVIGQDATKVIAVQKLENGGDYLTKLTIVKNRSGRSFGKVKLKIDFDKGTFDRPDEVIDTEVKGEENVLWK